MTDKLFGIDNRAILGQLFKAAFGTIPVYLTLPIGKKTPPDLSGYKPEVVEEMTYDEYERTSIYGTPIVFPILFKGKEYKVYDQTGQIIMRKYDDFWLPAATMVDFNRPKNIIKTNVLGGNGTVKEIYGFDDWAIRLRILCIDGDLKAREYEEKLIEFDKIIEPIEVKGYLFTKKEIHSIVIEEIDIRSVTGSPNVIPIELSCISDEAVEILNTKV
ncbi:DUF6046 domain-containing protein [Elizabethkingia anophelis]|uniref:DUF6046 domain-containing protein n=1 Tax=Elizabethkingia anophelis TaxID=1117645 RepID=UPI003F1BD6DC|nr:hypothetical protein [Elizabethkingia anophelis]